MLEMGTEEEIKACLSYEKNFHGIYFLLPEILLRRAIIRIQHQSEMYQKDSFWCQFFLYNFELIIELERKLFALEGHIKVCSG